jgi:predicted Zn finger-like uncharacterized protein
MSLLLSHRPRSATYPRGTITCRKCKTPIFVYRLAALADEFSVRCSKCGARSMYSKRDVVFEELPERRRKPRK